MHKSLRKLLCDVRSKPVTNLELTPSPTTGNLFTASNLLIFGMAIIFSWLGVRYFVRMRNLGYVDSAIGTMRTLIENENKFAQGHPNIGYSCNLQDLTDNPSVANGSWNGFVFELSRCQPSIGHIAAMRYILMARPLHSDLPAFCADESDILKADYDGSVTNCLKNGVPL